MSPLVKRVLGLWGPIALAFTGEATGHARGSRERSSFPKLALTNEVLTVLVKGPCRVGRCRCAASEQILLQVCSHN
jgi:hypothetical protein